MLKIPENVRDNKFVGWKKKKDKEIHNNETNTYELFFCLRVGEIRNSQNDTKSCAWCLCVKSIWNRMNFLHWKVLEK